MEKSRPTLFVPVSKLGFPLNTKFQITTIAVNILELHVITTHVLHVTKPWMQMNAEMQIK